MKLAIKGRYSIAFHRFTAPRRCHGLRRPLAPRSPRIVDQLAREFLGLRTGPAAELKDAIRSRLAKSRVSAEVTHAEVEKVVRGFGRRGGCGRNFCTHTGRTTEPASYEALGPALPGEQCAPCGEGGGVIQIRFEPGGEGELTARGLRLRSAGGGGRPAGRAAGSWDRPAGRAWRAARRDGAVHADAGHERRLRAIGYSDEQIRNLTPQQAHEILNQERRQANA
jgi:hypothetical protein